MRGLAGLYRDLIASREEVFSRRMDPVKESVPFDWGLEHLDLAGSLEAPGARLAEYADTALACSSEYFSGAAVEDYELQGRTLTFGSALRSGCAENDLVRGRWYESPRSKRAIVLLPNWNAEAKSFRPVAEILRLARISVLQLSLPYHDERQPPGMAFAEHMVSASIGRTICSSRQAVMDIRAAIDWLEVRGYQRVGLLGFSLGSSVGTIAACHDPRVRAAAFVFSAAHFGEVVWTGRATRHIRKALEHRISLDDLNHWWSVISPISYIRHLSAFRPHHLIIGGVYDGIFLPYLTRLLLEEYERHRVRYTFKRLPCGHHTIKMFPFSVVMLILVGSFLHRHL